MSDYVPTVGELLQAYVEASGASMAQESYYAEQVAEFERGIARIKAEAWDEGYEAAARYHDLDTEFSEPNPYREGGGTVNWDAQSDRAAIRYYSDWCPDGIQEAHRRGARWQRQALLSDEAVERAARALCAAAGENPDSNELWDEEPPWLSYADEARAALTAAIGGDDE